MNRDHMMGFAPAAEPADEAEGLSAWALDPRTRQRDIGCRIAVDDYTEAYPLGVPTRFQAESNAAMAELWDSLPPEPKKVGIEQAQPSDVAGIKRHNARIDRANGVLPKGICADRPLGWTLGDSIMRSRMAEEIEQRGQSLMAQMQASLFGVQHIEQHARLTQQGPCFGLDSDRFDRDAQGVAL